MEKRFKILFLLAQYSECTESFLDKLEELGNKIDSKNPQAEEALSYYEDKIIDILEEKLETPSKN